MRKLSPPESPTPEHEEEEESPESPDQEHHNQHDSGGSNSGESDSDSGITKKVDLTMVDQILTQV